MGVVDICRRPLITLRTSPAMQFRTIYLLTCLLAMPVLGQSAPVNPAEDVRTTLRLWVETMKQRQEQNDAWKRDQEVLQNYKDGLVREIEDLKKQIAATKERNQAADKESLDLTAKINAYQEAQKMLGEAVRTLESKAISQAKRLPSTLLKDPRMAQFVTEIQKDAQLSGEKQNDGLPKRINNVLSFLGEAEKWQQTIHVKEEVHQLKDGREMNLKVMYLGLSVAYGISAEGQVAIVGTPTADGWAFEEKPELFAPIAEAIASTIGDRDPSFTTLPVRLP
jgi:hypothetical protein